MAPTFLQLPDILCSQATHSQTFNPPPQNVFLSVAQIYDWHAEHSTHHPLFLYFDDTRNTKVKITWHQAVQAVYRIGDSILRHVTHTSTQRSLVGLYSSSDTFTYILSLIGIMRAGLPVLLLSSRTSPVALKHMIVESGVSHILMDRNDTELASRLQSVQQNMSSSITVSYVPSWDDLFSEEAPVKLPALTPGLDDLCLILHSSGSTALPELNFYTHRMVNTALWQPWYGAKDICGQVLSTPSIPMAGAAGVMQALFSASSGLVISGFKPTSPPAIPTPATVWKNMISTNSTYSFVLQPFLSVWSEDPDKIPILAGLEGVMFGGGPLMKSVGDLLADKGVNIFPLFGSSEGGLLNKVFPENMGVNWEYFSFYSLVNPALRKNTDDGTVELVLKGCPTHVPTKTNTIFEGVPAYATGDLIEPHPSIPGLWRFLCRVADQEVIGPGRKVNAVALARNLMADPNIAGAVLVSMNVGSSIAFGAIIEMSGSSAQGEVDTYKHLIWPSIERYNEIAPDPARLSKQNIIIASKSKPFSYGEKGMPLRKEVIKAYKEEIMKLV
ncbi:acetyl-CoA synthetase-like protein [Agrocybe pediades]|nr:acetyl-CoA synthetase-like protein [Agrocybe pediades]